MSKSEKLRVGKKLIKHGETLDLLFKNGDQAQFTELVQLLYDDLQKSAPLNQEIHPSLSMFPFSFKEAILFSLLSRVINQRVLSGYYDDRLVILPTLEKSASTLHEIILMRMLEVERGVAGYTPLLRSLVKGGPISLAGSDNMNLGMLFYLINGGVMRGVFSPSFSNETFFKNQLKSKVIVLLRHPADRLVAQFCMYHPYLLESEENKKISEEHILTNMLKGKYSKIISKNMTHFQSPIGIQQTIEWIGGWVKQAKDHNILLSKYENMVDHFEVHFQEIYKYLFNKEADETRLTEFKILSQETKEGGKHQPGDAKARSYKKGYSGKIGIWKDYFSKKDVTLYNDIVKKHLAYHDTQEDILKLYPDLILQEKKYTLSLFFFLTS